MKLCWEATESALGSCVKSPLTDEASANGHEFHFDRCDIYRVDL